MYTWQTLALSRVEFRCRDLGFVSHRLKERVRDLLYVIGQPHFPNPDVMIAGIGNSAVELRWNVDHRALTLTVTYEGDATFERHYTQDSFEPHDRGDLSSGDPELVWGLVEWLLFGTCPPVG